MSGQAPNDMATASGRKDAVRKAFNQEYMATQQAMTQAAERARAQVIDQRHTIANYAEDVKAGTKTQQPPIGSQQGAPHMASDPNRHSDQQVMFDIATEIRNLITREVDMRMQLLSEKVETALANAFPPQEPSETSEPTQSKRTTRGNRSTKKP
ncbi:MAG: hypothetical protein KTR23_10165 [Rhodospirillales bacterium]|nr:hypothetical protein [Rhodospirillales bacterium]